MEKTVLRLKLSFWESRKKDSSYDDNRFLDQLSNLYLKIDVCGCEWCYFQQLLTF